MDESNAILAENTSVRGLNQGLSGYLGQGVIYKDSSPDANSYAKMEWKINIPSSGNYQICVRYANLAADSNRLIFFPSTNQMYMSNPLPVSNQSFNESCHSRYLTYGLKPFVIKHWSDNLVIDQITVQ